MKAFVFLFLLFSPHLLIAQNKADEDEAGKLYAEYKKESNMGNFQEAKDKLLSILKGNYQLSTYHIYLIHRALGLTEKSLGNYNIARFYYNKALDVIGEDDQYLDSRILTLLNLGNVELDDGDFFLALTYYEKAETLLERSKEVTEKVKRDLALIRINQAEALYQLKDFAGSTEYVHEAMSKQVRVDKPNVYFSCYKLGRNYKKLGMIDSSDHYYREAIRWLVQDYDSSFFRLAPIYYDYADLLTRKGSYRAAHRLLLKSLAIYKNKYGNSSEFTSVGYAELSKFHLKTGRMDSAEYYANQALRIFETSGNGKEINADLMLKSTSDRNYIYVLRNKTNLYNQ